MFKKLTLFILCYCCTAAFAQKVSYTIKGTAVGYDDQYLYLFLKKRFEMPAELFKVQIKNGQFLFHITIDLNGTNYASADLMMYPSGDITLSDVAKRYRKDLFNYRTVVVENMTVTMNKKDGLKQAVCKGGLLNKYHDEYTVMLRNSGGQMEQRHLQFITAHRDSPIALLAVSVYSGTMFEKIPWSKVFYDKLSREMKATKQGQLLGKKINSQYNSLPLDQRTL